MWSLSANQRTLGGTTAVSDSKQVKVQAIMTAPRYEGTWCRTNIEAALRQIKIPLNVGLGVFYHQNMQRMMEDAITAGVDYIVTIDFDTLFTSDQLHRLISIAVQEDFDCVTGIQVKRGKPWMLGFKEGHTSAAWRGYPIEVDAAHFGLTVVNAHRLASVAKPWFVCQPDEHGSWGDNRIDSDVWFWKQWKAAGLKLWIDPGVRLGHLEEMVVIHDENMRPKHIYPKDWEEMMQAEYNARQKEEANEREDVEAMERVASGSPAD
jgi:hypothetical protein